MCAIKNQLKIFENKEFGKVRVIEIDGQPWFVGKDIAEALGYANTGKAVIEHIDKEDRVKQMIPHSRNGKMVSPTTLINESGLYSLIMSSRLPTVKAFRRWVTSEILPSIRKHGAYITDNTLDRLLQDPESALKLLAMLKAEQEKKEALLDFVEIIAPKALYYDFILKCDNTIPISVIAKDYGMTAIAFNKLLHGIGVQYNVGGTWVLYKKHCNHGYTITRTYHVNETTADIRTYWTQKGRYFLYETLKCFGVLPEAEKGGYLCLT